MTTRPSVFYRGRTDKPLVVFIHGMGLDERIWVRPAEARVLGGKYPLTVLMRGAGAGLKTLFESCREQGFTVLTWSQRRPVGPIAAAAGELSDLIERHRPYTGNGVILVGHSRGGLVARKYLERKSGVVRGIVTIATPHHGTSLAKWVDYVGPLASVAHRFVGARNEEEARTVLQRIVGFLVSTGVRELYPRSPFFAELRDGLREGIRSVSVGGTDPHLVKLGPVSLADLMRRIMPSPLVPVELKDGCGDGMVSAESAVLPCGSEHRDFPVNHVTVLFDNEVREYIMNAVEGMS